MIQRLQKYEYVWVALWGVILFIPFLGNVHLFDWDEINFAESAREMLVSENYQQVQINFQPFTEKPPLFFWLQALSMHFFGVSEFAARLPNALIGIVSLLLIYHIGKKWFDRSFATLWVLFITGSLTPHLYYKTGIIDPLYNLFIFSAVYQLFLYTLHQNVRNALYLGVFLGLAIITKGPVAVVVVLLVFIVYWIRNRFRLFFQPSHLVYTTLCAFFVSAIWFGLETIQHGPSFLISFIQYQADLFLHPVAGHGQPWYYHPVVLLLGCFPASVIALPLLFGNINKRLPAGEEKSQQLAGMMKLFFWVVLILFSIVETKIVHYSSLCYFPLTFLAALYAQSLIQSKSRLNFFQYFFFVLVTFVLSAILILLPYSDQWKWYLIPKIEDAFTRGCLSVSANWQGYESLFGVLYFIMMTTAFILLIRKKYDLSFRFILVSGSFIIPVMLAVYAPRIESYSQLPAIEFYESLQAKDVYVETLGYKSYAQYFYSRIRKPNNKEASDMQWLLNGRLDKEAYFVLQLGDINDHINPTMQMVGRKGGFVFYKREPGRTLEDVVKP